MESDIKRDQGMVQKGLILVAVLLLSGCSHYRWIHKHSGEVCEILDCCPEVETVTVIETKIDTFTEIRRTVDTTTLNRLFRCDSNNRVLSRANDSLSSHKDTIPIERIITIYKSDTVRTTVTHVKTVEKPVIVKEKYVPWYLWTLWVIVSVGLLIGTILIVSKFR